MGGFLAPGEIGRTVSVSPSYHFEIRKADPFQPCLQFFHVDSFRRGLSANWALRHDDPRLTQNWVDSSVSPHHFLWSSREGLLGIAVRPTTGSRASGPALDGSESEG
jgi:hypothetical protein